MAKAFKCDRCGNYYDPNDNEPMYMVVDRDLDEWRALDFCVPCTIALKDWMSLPDRTKRKDLDNCRGVVEVKRPVGRPKKVNADSLAAKAEEAKKQEKLSKVLDEMAKKRGEDE